MSTFLFVPLYVSLSLCLFKCLPFSMCPLKCKSTLCSFLSQPFSASHSFGPFIWDNLYVSLSLFVSLLLLSIVSISLSESVSHCSLFCQSLPPPLTPEILIMLHTDPVAQPNTYGRFKLLDFCLGSLVRYQHICQIRHNLFPIIQYISPIKHRKFPISYLVLSSQLGISYIFYTFVL